MIKRPARTTSLTYCTGQIAFARAALMGRFGDCHTVALDAALETQPSAKPWAANHQITAKPGMEDV